ncbi:hypothetical protein IAU59_003178 [Kwoniella sp. CBS 9459]
MVTKSSPDSSSSESLAPPATVTSSTANEQTTADAGGDVNAGVQAGEESQPGFFGLLVKSVFEPGANAAVVMAMNLCFFFLILTLFGLYALTGWNKHVLLLLGVTSLLWGSMVWFVMELTKVQNRPDNMPPSLSLDDMDITSDPVVTSVEPKKDR